MKKIKIALIIILALGSLIGYSVIKPYYEFSKKTLNIDPITILLSTNSVKKIDGTVNILILGIPGGSHEGPNLSDSITVAHYDFKTNHLTTIGIPRDIWSNTLRDKINTAYAYGEAKQEDGGLKLAKAEVGAILGMPIQYSVVISFTKFKDLVDFLGGIDVSVEKSFTDKDFPIEGKENDNCNGDLKYRCRYETVAFREGLIHMNGATALKFVRSRHAEGEEGGDFSRSGRQQLVIAALKNKVIDIAKSYNIKKLEDLYRKADSLVNRDVTNQELAMIVKSFFLKKNYKQINLFLPEELFLVPNYIDYDGKYVLIPKSGSMNSVYKYVACFIEKEEKNACEYLIDEGKED